MSTQIETVATSDNEAVVRAIAAGRKLDPDVVRRVRARAQQVTDEVYRKHGKLDVAIPAIREVRDA